MFDDEIDYTEDIGYLEEDPAWATNGKPFSFDLDDDILLTEEEKIEGEKWLKDDFEEDKTQIEKFDPNK